MSRQLFERWGVALPEEHFAGALAAAALLGPVEKPLPIEQLEDIAHTLRKERIDIVPVKLNNVARVAAAIREPKARLVPAEVYAAHWNSLQSIWYAVKEPEWPLLRLEIAPRVDPALRNAAPDLIWMSRLLQGNENVASAAYVRVDDPDQPVAWEWPLRVGILHDQRSDELVTQIKTCPWPDLYTLVPLDSRDDDCDILLLPYDLRDALTRVLRAPRLLQVECVLLTAGAGVPPERILPLVSVIRSEVRTSGVGMVKVSPEHHAAWFKAFLEELSHNLPLDVALVRANRVASIHEDRPEPPLLFGSRRLAENARVAAFARRYGQQIQHMIAARATTPTASTRPLGEDGRAFEPAQTAGRPVRRATRDRDATLSAPLIEHAAAEILQRGERAEWASERGDASEVARARRVVETGLGGRVPLARNGGTPPSRPRDRRRMNFELTDMTEPDEPREVKDRLQRDRVYEMLLFIGLPRADVESASGTFPSHRLPPSTEGHWLDVFFIPLVHDKSGRPDAPLRGRIHHKSEGDSTPCTFGLRTHGLTGDYRARVIVCHETRVIQTLIFSSPLGGSKRRFALDVENPVAPGFDYAGDGRSFDAAIVVNHAVNGQAGVATIVGQEAGFREPVGIDGPIDAVKQLITGDASLPEPRDALNDKDLVALLAKLADYGKAIWELLPEQNRAALARARRVQVVEARRGAWLPVEFFYDQRVPNDDATMCPNAQAALLSTGRDSAELHEECRYREDRAHHCPLRFWGFNRVIERQPPFEMPANADYQISVPTAGNQRLDMLKRALLGASNKVRPEDFGGPDGVLAAVKHAVEQTATAPDWTQWETKVQEMSPTLLLLLPHTQDAPGYANMPALEIGETFLRFSQLEKEHVSGPQYEAPVVFLLGCSTQLAGVPFMNFVQAFKAKKAALVVGTLATIRGRRTVDFVKNLLESLKAAAGSNRTFGEVFLDTKRKLLAKGDGFVLSLTAYGDVGWRL